MSGGYVKPGLKAGEHMVVIFTFKGPIDSVKADEWNKQIDKLKHTLGDKATAVTLDGENKPAIYKKP